MFYFINYCLNYLITILHYSFCYLYALPLFIFLTLSILYVYPFDFNHYLNTSMNFMFITLDYLWRKIFNLEIISYMLLFPPHQNTYEEEAEYIPYDSDEDNYYSLVLDDY